jgi:glutamate dehydrogenase (NADP+)
MDAKMQAKIDGFMEEVKTRNGHEPEFIQAVQEVAETVIPYIARKKIYSGKNILLRMVEPERLISFRVSWIDDKGEIHVNRGYRIQMNSAIGFIHQ